MSVFSMLGTGNGMPGDLRGSCCGVWEQHAEACGRDVYCFAAQHRWIPCRGSARWPRLWWPRLCQHLKATRLKPADAAVCSSYCYASPAGTVRLFHRTWCCWQQGRPCAQSAVLFALVLGLGVDVIGCAALSAVSHRVVLGAPLLAHRLIWAQQVWSSAAHPSMRVTVAGRGGFD